MNSDLTRLRPATKATTSALSSPSTKNQELPVLLIVEDEILLRMAIADEMREGGFVVFEAENGDEALSLLRSYPQVEAVFSDVCMPGTVDGIALAQIVNRNYPRAKMFLTSGIKMPLQGVAVAFFPKPYLIPHVAGAIKQACGIPDRG